MKGQRLTPALPQAGGPRDLLNAVKLVAAGWANPARHRCYRWHFAQKKLDRPPWTIRSTVPPQAQGSPSRP